MAMVKVEFEADNAAFEGVEGPMEVRRILRVVADKIDAGLTEGAILDINGNVVGSFEYMRSEA